ncbi:MAG: class I tRNA ligase family protein, partial [Candidatus Pacebacteria bacterium]|nr:class I tRNA ligase family protein [Candidatus Paceibacterota bacterium]
FIAETIGFDKAQIQTDARIGEYCFGIFNMKGFDEYFNYRAGHEFDMNFAIPEGESLQDAKNRFAEFLYEIDSKYENKNIVISTHGIAFQVMQAVLDCLNEKDSAKNISGTFRKIENGHLEIFELVKLPHNKNYEVDLHRPYIDSVVLVNEDGVEHFRIPEVIDCWFESGSMPYAQDHYPFERPNWQKENFPAGFVAEYMSQTRTWFYYSHVLSTILFGHAPFENVVTTGTLQATDGQKMSKSKGNYPDPWIIFDKFGVDALRLYLMASPLMKGEDTNFSEKLVGDIAMKIIGRLMNVVSFYELYRNVAIENKERPNSVNVLDVWIVSRLDQVSHEIFEAMESYELDKAGRPFDLFVDDLSTWYLRRSRDRLKDGDADAKQTLYYVLKTMAKLMAPFAPFTAEDIWQKLRINSDELSVHLTEWPVAKKVDEVLLTEMVKVREVCTEGNALRKKLNIAVKQPLASFTVVGELSNTYFEIIMDELNVKQILVGTEFVYDTEITPELKREGNYRELVRALQDLRKETGLTPDDVINLKISTNAQDLLAGFESDLKKTVQISQIEFTDGENEVVIDGQVYKVSIQK